MLTEDERRRGEGEEKERRRRGGADKRRRGVEEEEYERRIRSMERVKGRGIKKLTRLAMSRVSYHFPFL